MAFFGNSTGYAVAVLTGIVVARALGPAGKGVAAYTALVMGLFTTFGSGLQNAIMHECGRNGRPQALAYGSAVRLLALAAIPVVGSLIAIAMRIPNDASFAFVACALPFAVYAQIATAVLFLNDDVRSVVVQGLFPTVGVGALTIPALTLFHGGLTAVLAIWAGSFVAAGCFLSARVNAHLSAFGAPGDWELMRALARFGTKSGTTSLAAFLNLRIDVFVVSFMLDVRVLGVYTLAVATGELMWQVSRPIVFASLGRIASSERPRAITIACTLVRNLLAIEVLVAIVIFAFAPAAVHWVYGAAYDESSTVVRWLLPGLVVYAVQTPLTYFIMVQEGKPMVILAIQGASMLACALLSVLTIPRLGIVGAALATVVTYCFSVTAIAWAFSRWTGASPSSFLMLNRSDFALMRSLLERLAPRRLLPWASTRT